MEGVETATILTFPKRSVRQESLFAEGDLVELWRVQLACATALHDCAMALESLALILKNILADTSRDCTRT
jgi:hypothetical protein